VCVEVREMKEGKMTTENIFREIYELICYWEESGGAPRRFKGSLVRSDAWKRSALVPMSYAIFENLIMEQLKLTKQHRICREKWLYFLRQKFILEKKVNQYETHYSISLIDVRDIIGLEDPYKTEEELQDSLRISMATVDREISLGMVR
jgi:hypothetical protein